MKSLVASLRSLRRAPAFSVLVILTLALGIGATTAMFSVVDNVLINPIPFPHADRVTDLSMRYEEGASRAPAATATVIATLREQQDLFDVVGAFQYGAGTLTGAGDPEMLSFPQLSANIFSIFPVAPIAGRLFTPADATASERVLLLAEPFWIARFGSDPGVVGKVLTIDDVPYRVIGVVPARFRLPETGPDAWRVVDIDDPKTRARVQLVAMRNAGVTRQQADDRLKTLSASMQSSGVLGKGQSLVTDLPLAIRMSSGSANALYLLLGAVAVLLIVACVNVCNLMLVRASSRHGELALMAAVGAGRRRLLRDAALESIMLAIAGGALGVWLASGLLDVILSLAPEQMRILSRAAGGLDLRAVAFAIAATAATSITFGMLPAWRVSRVDPLDALKQQSRAAAGSRDDWWQGALVSIQITLVVVLLAGAGLLLRSFVKLSQVDLGFAPDGLALVELQMTAPPYAAPNAALNFAREVERRVESQMAMQATVITASPVRGGGFHVEAVPEAEGLTPPPGTIELPASRISPDFFEVFRIPMIEGRTFQPDDGDAVVIVNDVLARRYWGTASPIGKRFRADKDTPWLTVVGVSGDVKHFGPADPMGNGMEIYEPYPASSRSNNFLTIAVAAGDRPEAALPLMKRIIWDIDPRMPISTALTLNQQLDGTLARPRFILTLAGAFTVCAVLIAAVGVYGVSSYWVLRRRRELAIRMAIGASPDRLVWSVLKRSLVLSAIGIVAGLVITAAGARVMTSLLFATDPRDPLTLVAVAIALGLIAVVACAGPAFRAARVDPMTTLRAE